MNTLSIVACFGALVWIFQDGNLSSLLGLPAARVRRDHAARDPVLRPVRAVDGLRGVPAVADEGGLGPDRRQHRGGRARPRAERAGSCSSAALIVVVVAGLVRVRRHRADQGARAGRRDRRRPRCDGRPGAAGPGDDAAARPLELVGPGAARPRAPARSSRAPRPRPRPPSDEPPDAAPSPLARSSPSSRSSSRLRRARSSPTRPRRRPSSRPRPAAPPRPPDPRPVVLPRDDGPHDRLTEWWYYTGHLARRRRPPVRLRVRGLPRGARRLPGVLGVAPRPDRRDRRPRSTTPSAAEIGPQVDRSPRGAGGDADRASRSRSRASTSPPARPPRRRRGRWPAAAARTRSRRRRRRRGARRPRRGFGLDLALARRKPPALHDEDGYDRLRAGRRLVLLLADRDGRRPARSRSASGRSTVTGDAWFDHQWGDFISVGGGGWDWFAVNLDDGTDLTLSLVRAADGSLPARVRHARRRRRHDAPPRPRTTSPSSRRPTLDEPRDRRHLPGRLDGQRCPARTSRSSSRRRSPSRSSTPARRPASSTGRARSA